MRLTAALGTMKSAQNKAAAKLKNNAAADVTFKKVCVNVADRAARPIALVT